MGGPARTASKRRDYRHAARSGNISRSALNYHPRTEIQMSRAFAELNPSGDKIEVHFRYDPDLVKSIKDVPGAHFVNASNGGPMWTVPLNLDIARRLNENIGPDLVLG